MTDKYLKGLKWPIWLSFWHNWRYSNKKQPIEGCTSQKQRSLVKITRDTPTILDKQKIMYVFSPSKMALFFYFLVSQEEVTAAPRKDCYHVTRSFSIKIIQYLYTVSQFLFYKYTHDTWLFGKKGWPLYRYVWPLLLVYLKIIVMKFVTFYSESGNI